MGHFLILALLWIGHFSVDFMLGIWSVYKTVSAIDLGIAGLMAATCALAGEGGQIIFGALADRGGRKRLIAIGILLTGASAFLSSTESYFFSFFLLLLTCIGSGAFHPSAVSLVGSLTSTRKSLYISIFASGGSLGMALSQTVFFQIHRELQGNTILLFLPHLFLVILLFLCGYMQKEKVISEGSKRAGFALSLFGQYFKNRALRMLYIVQVCNQTICWATIFLLPDVLSSRGYDEKISFGGGHMAFILGGALAMIPSGYLADHLSERKIILIATGLGVCFYFAFLSLPFLPNVELLILLFLTGASLGIVQPIAVALGNELGKENPGLVSAFTMGMVWCVSETIGLGSSGFLTKIFSDDAPAKALMLLGALFPFLFYAAKELTSEPSLEKITIG